MRVFALAIAIIMLLLIPTVQDSVCRFIVNRRAHFSG